MAELENRNDQHWLDALAGRATPNADAATVKEAQALRRAVLAAKPDQAAQDLDVEAGAQKLLFRLRREGLEKAASKKKSWQTYGAFAIAASLVLAIGVVVLQPPMDETPNYRGGGAQTITAPDTAKLAATLTADLEALGIQPKVTRFGSNYTINAPWPAKPDAKHAAFLKRHALKQPESGGLVVELLQSESKK